jgi:hypothetical protein
MKKIPLLLFMLLLCAGVYAQNLSKSGVLKLNLRSTGPIVQNGQVKGYYLFFMVEKQDRKNYNYQLNVYDENLREISSVNVVRPRTFVLVEGAFNGEVFGFMFYDSKGKAVELMAYDKKLKETGSVKIGVTNKYLLATYKNIAIGNDPAQAFFVPVSNKGFLYYGLKSGSKMHYEMQFLDNSMKTVWSEKVDDKAKHAVEIASEAFQSEKYIGTLVTTKSGIASRNT